MQTVLSSCFPWMIWRGHKTVLWYGWRGGECHLLILFPHNFTFFATFLNFHASRFSEEEIRHNLQLFTVCNVCLGSGKKDLRGMTSFRSMEVKKKKEEEDSTVWFGEDCEKESLTEGKKVYREKARELTAVTPWLWPLKEKDAVVILARLKKERIKQRGKNILSKGKIIDVLTQFHAVFHSLLFLLITAFIIHNCWEKVWGEGGGVGEEAES